MKSREYTREEIIDNFLGAIRTEVSYWSKQEQLTEGEKLEGVVFSILVILDGESNLPSFSVVPMPHPDDQHYNMSKGDNYYPYTPDHLLKHDIGGNLHERWSKKYARQRNQ